MGSLLVSILIPAYRGHLVVGRAIESVLRQTYPNFELIVVDDASPDDTGEIVKDYTERDSRVVYIRHAQNGGADAARRTGLAASRGEIVSFLDQDDLIHPDKLQEHIKYFEQHPDVGITYNSRFELNYSSNTVREIFRPPEEITLADLLLGFPISPSEVVIKRMWAIKPEIWDDSFVHQGYEVIDNGSEMVFCGRLFLAGCKFGFVDRALNYRSHQLGRLFSDLELRYKAELMCQDIIFNDPRCPETVRAIRNVSYTNTYCVWAYHAFLQNDFTLGQELFRKAVGLNPAILSGEHCMLMHWIVSQAIVQYQTDHAEELSFVFSNLPDELSLLRPQLSWAIAQGFLIKGIRAVMWDLPDGGDNLFQQAAKCAVEVDDSIIALLTHQLMLFEKEFGGEAAELVLDKLEPYLAKLGGNRSVRWLKGNLAVNRAFGSYRAGYQDKVTAHVTRAIKNDARYLLNRGVMAIFIRSLFGKYLVR